MHLPRSPALVLLCMLAACPVRADDAAPPVADSAQARWEAQQLELTFFFFTSIYTCEGIRAQLEKLLLAMGARDDIRFGGICYNAPVRRLDQVDSHRIQIAFSIPVQAEGGGTPGETFPAQWREVEIESGKPRSILPGDCELVAQFAKKVLPLFNPDAVTRLPNCKTRGQQFAGEPVLRATVLIPVAPPEPPAGTAPAAPAQPAEPAEPEKREH